MSLQWTAAGQTGRTGQAAPCPVEMETKPGHETVATRPHWTVGLTVRATTQTGSLVTNKAVQVSTLLENLNFTF